MKIKTSVIYLLLTFFFAILLTENVQSKIYHCTVNLSEKKGSVSKELFGTNIEWFNNANGIFDPVRGKIKKEFITLAKKQGISLIRFPGGILSDFYHWQDGIGTPFSRKTSPHFTDPGSSKNVFGSPELIKFCDQIGAKPLITVNVGTGSPDEAAAWVSYMNDPQNAQRIKDGIRKPAKVQLWEIGNELYLDGNDAEKKIALSPEAYVARYTAFADRMRAVDPTISLMAIGVAGSYNIPFGPHRNWNLKILEGLSGKMDYLSLHNGYFPVLYDDTQTYSNKEVYQALWGAPLSVDRDIEEKKSLINMICKNSRPGIAVTEWGPFFSITSPKWTDHVKTMGSAVFTARMFQVFLSHPEVKIATFFKYTDSTFMGWISYDTVPKIPYYVVKLYAGHFGTYIVDSAVETPFYGSKKIGFIKSVSKVPVLNVVSSVNNTFDSVYINIVSCSWDTPYQVKLEIKNCPSGFDLSNGVMRIIKAESPLSHNGQDLPDWWPIKHIEPSKYRKHISIETENLDCTEPVTIPPASVVMIELKKME